MKITNKPPTVSRQFPGTLPELEADNVAEVHGPEERVPFEITPSIEGCGAADSGKIPHDPQGRQHRLATASTALQGVEDNGRGIIGLGRKASGRVTVKFAKTPDKFLDLQPGAVGKKAVGEDDALGIFLTDLGEAL